MTNALNAVGLLWRGVILRGSYCFADDETLGHAPPEAVPQDNLVVFLSTPRKILMKFLGLKLSHCNEEKEKGDFTS